MEERDAALWFSVMETMTPALYDRLTALYGSADAAWRSEEPPIPDSVKREWRDLHDRFRLCQPWDMEKEWEDRNIRYLSRNDEDYPDLLRELADPPIGIWLRGHLPESVIPAVSVIGSRNCTLYGKEEASRLGKSLGECGVPLISGMAKGIDGTGQKAALSVGGYSLGILGSGVDVCYPRENRELYEHLIRQGGILSEYPPGSPPAGWHFPGRNRLIAALGRIMVVVEARKRSGTMISVDQALELGREIFAVPGRLEDMNSEGCNDLIRQGAGIYLGPETVYRGLGWSEEKICWATETGDDRRFSKKLLTQREIRIWECLGKKTMTMEELCKAVGGSEEEVLQSVNKMRMFGLCLAEGERVRRKR